MEAKEGVILDQNGSVIAGRESSSAGRSHIAWGKTQGWLPKIFLGAVIAAALFFGFGIISVFALVMLVSFVLRTVLGLFGLTAPRPRSKFIFTVRR